MLIDPSTLATFDEILSVLTVEREVLKGRSSSEWAYLLYRLERSACARSLLGICSTAHLF